MEAVARKSDFDYSGLPAETRIVVQQRTSEIRSLMKRTASDIIEIGQKLIEVKDQLGHGKFGAWLEAEFAWSDRTAQKFMRVADSFKSEPGSDLIPPKALYLLSAPSTPEAAREEAVDRAESGEQITPGKAREIREKHVASECSGKPSAGSDGSVTSGARSSEAGEKGTQKRPETGLEPLDDKRSQRVARAQEETLEEIRQLGRDFGLRRGAIMYCSNRRVRCRWPPMAVKQIRKILTFLQRELPEILKEV